MKPLYTLTFFLLTIFSLNAQTKFSEKVGGHIYHLTIPDYMTKTSLLNDNASLQYQDTLKITYVICLEDDKETLLEIGSPFKDAMDFYNYFIKDYQLEAENRKVTTPIEFTANKNKCIQSELTYTSEGVDLYFLVTVIESKTHFYKILCWTVGENKDKYKSDFLKISSSLRD